MPSSSITRVPCVRRFSDYRAFLLEHWQGRKADNPGFTMGAWAHQLRLKDTSSISKVIQGKRHPGPKLTDRLVSYFGFDHRDAEYFKDLIALHKLKREPRLALLLMEKLKKDNPSIRAHLLDERSFRLIANWWCLAIREFVKVKHFKEDPSWLARRFRFKVTHREVARAIELLLELGLLGRDSSGRLEVRYFRFTTSNDFASEAIKSYHQSLLGHAKAAVREIDVDEREFQSVCIAMRYDKIPQAKQLVREFMAKLESLLEDDDPDGVFQAQVQLFPLTKSINRCGPQAAPSGGKK